MPKTEKRGNKYRIRKTVNKQTFCLSFDHKPSKAEIDLAMVKAYSAAPKTGDKRSFEECAKDYIKINDGILSPNTLQEDEGYLRRLPESFKKRPVCDFTEQIVQAYINDYAKEISPHTKRRRAPKTVKNMYGFIEVVLRHYGKHVFSINLPQPKEDDTYMPTEEDIVKLLEHIKGEELEVPVMIAAFSSLRESEICALTVDDVKNNMIHVNKAVYRDRKAKEWKVKDYPKTDTSQRYTAIPNKLQRLIKKKGYIYAYTPNRLLKQLHKAQDECKIPRFTFHRLRTYYASASHALNVPDQYIMKNGGWKSAETLHKHYRKALRDKQTVMDKKITDHFSSLV